MRNFCAILTVFVGTVFCLFTSPAYGTGADGETFHLKEVKALYFHEPSCPFCETFEKKTLKDMNIKIEISKVSWMKVNAFEDKPLSINGKPVSQQELAERYEINIYPTVIFLAPNGKELTRIRGLFPISDFLKMTRYITERFFEKESFENYLGRTAKLAPTY